MPKIPTTPQGIEFQLRPGAPPFGPAGWRGVNTEDDPVSLDPNELQRGDDVRLKGRIITPRPGLVEKIDLGVDPVTWLLEAPVDNPRVRLWLTALGCFGTAIGTGATIMHVDPTENPVVQTYGNYFATADRQIPLGRYGDKLFVGDKSALREVVEVTAPPGTSIALIAPNPPQVPVITFPGFTIRCLLEFDSLLFIGLENDATPTSSKIVAWNGISARDDLTGIRPPLAFGIWRDKLVAGFDATAGNIRYRDKGSVPGTWTTVALAGFRCATQGNVMQEARQYLFIASGIGDIYRFDGAALTVVRSIAAAAADGKGVTALTLHKGLLYYGWNTPSAAYASRIGRHDPDSTAANEWIDTYKDITTEIANFIELQSMQSYRGQIYCGGRQVWIVATAVNDVKGTLETISNTGAPGAGFGLMQLLRHP